ncbi:14331_t:CDS:1, partial [Racocetra persica]
MYKRGYYSKGRSPVNANIVNQKGNYKTYNSAGEIINDTKATSNIKGEVFEYYSSPVNADKADNLSLVKGEVQTSAVRDQNFQ